MPAQILILFYPALPYQWQYRHGSHWEDVPIDDNREIETEFCRPEVDGVKVQISGLGYLTINFQRMTGEAGGFGKLRRFFIYFVDLRSEMAVSMYRYITELCIRKTKFSQLLT